jgi:hypothetical protein
VATAIARGGLPNKTLIIELFGEPTGNSLVR